jgi:hypothetical protein
VIEAHGLRNVHLYEDPKSGSTIRDAVGDLTRDFLVLNEVYPKGFSIPKRFIGENIIHLPTVKTHVFTTTTGAMKNAFGGLLNEHRHWTHPVIHETLVDLLMIQKKIHPGVFAVMDGTFAGDGPGPRCMIPHVKNVMLASADQVAIDAVAAKLMGFDPMEIKFIRLAHELGLGCGGPARIEIVGDVDAAEERWDFVGPFKKMTFASRMQHKIYWGPPEAPLEWSLKTVARPVGLRRQRPLPRLLLVSRPRRGPRPPGPQERLGPPLPELGEPRARRARLPRRGPGAGPARAAHAGDGREGRPHPRHLHRRGPGDQRPSSKGYFPVSRSNSCAPIRTTNR